MEPSPHVTAESTYEKNALVGFKLDVAQENGI